MILLALVAAPPEDICALYDEGVRFEWSQSPSGQGGQIFELLKVMVANQIRSSSHVTAPTTEAQDQDNRPSEYPHSQDQAPRRDSQESEDASYQEADESPPEMVPAKVAVQLTVISPTVTPMMGVVPGPLRFRGTAAGGDDVSRRSKKTRCMPAPDTTTSTQSMGYTAPNPSGEVLALMTPLSMARAFLPPSADPEGWSTVPPGGRMTWSPRLRQTWEQQQLLMRNATNEHTVAQDVYDQMKRYSVDAAILYQCQQAVLASQSYEQECLGMLQTFVTRADRLTAQQIDASSQAGGSSCADVTPSNIPSSAQLSRWSQGTDISRRPQDTDAEYLDSLEVPYSDALAVVPRCLDPNPKSTPTSESSQVRIRDYRLCRPPYYSGTRPVMHDDVPFFYQIIHAMNQARGISINSSYRPNPIGGFSHEPTFTGFVWEYTQEEKKANLIVHFSTPRCARAFMTLVGKTIICKCGEENIPGCGVCVSKDGHCFHGPLEYMRQLQSLPRERTVEAILSSMYIRPDRAPSLVYLPVEECIPVPPRTLTMKMPHATHSSKMLDARVLQSVLNRCETERGRHYLVARQSPDTVVEVVFDPEFEELQVASNVCGRPFLASHVHSPANSSSHYAILRITVYKGVSLARETRYGDRVARQLHAVPFNPELVGGLLLLKLKPHEDDAKKMLIGYVDGLAYDLTKCDLGKVLLDQAVQLMCRIAVVGNETHPHSVMEAWISHACRGIDLHARAMNLAGWTLTEGVGGNRKTPSTPNRYDAAEIRKALLPDSDIRNLDGYEYLHNVPLKTTGLRVVHDGKPVHQISNFRLGSGTGRRPSRDSCEFPSPLHHESFRSADAPRRPSQDSGEFLSRDESFRSADIHRHPSRGGGGDSGRPDRSTYSHGGSAPRAPGHYDEVCRDDAPRHTGEGSGSSHGRHDPSTYSRSRPIFSAPVRHAEVTRSRAPPPPPSFGGSSGVVRPRVFLTREERDHLGEIMRDVMRGPSGTCLPSTHNVSRGERLPISSQRMVPRNPIKTSLKQMWNWIDTNTVDQNQSAPAPEELKVLRIWLRNMLTRPGMAFRTIVQELHQVLARRREFEYARAMDNSELETLGETLVDQPVIPDLDYDLISEADTEAVGDAGDATFDDYSMTGETTVYTE